MHELTVCESLLDIIDREHKTRGFSQVRRIRLEIGCFSCLEPDALRYAFEILSRETMLENARLDIERPLGKALCLDCQAEVEVESRLSPCPRCQSLRLQPKGGDTMRFIDMEVF